LLRGFLGFLNDPVKDYDLLVHNAKEDPDNPITEFRADLPQAFSKVVHERFADGPSPLDKLDVGSDGLFLVGRKFLEPFAGWLLAIGISEKPHFKWSRSRFCHA
jgi:hypothetical protein